MRLPRPLALFMIIFSSSVVWYVSRAAADVAGTAATASSADATTQPRNFARWEKEIAAMEAADKTSPPPKGGVLFIGSSTIRGWKTLAQDYPDHQVINRGFGGSQIVDSTHFADRLIFPHEPKMVLLRAGGNDIHAGKSAEQVFAEFQDFVKTIHAKLPETDIVFIGLSPAPARWSEHDENKKLNALVEAYTKTTPRVKYVDTYDTTLTPDGQAREELFVKDKLHFNAEGYKLLAERVRPVLPAKS
jgi:lysophospholipase L1-like esterase